MKLAVVVPRFGASVTGGAETAARQLSGRLAAGPDWSVDVFTTCALDATTWANELPEGTETDGAMTVHRFAVERTRPADFDTATRRVVFRRSQVTIEDQHRWVEDQGPLSRPLVAAVAQTDADVVAFHPYLYYPTVAGLPAVRDRAVLHAAAHDEAPIRLPIYRDLFRQAAALVFWSDAERRLVERLFPVGAHRQLVSGLGVEPGSGDAEHARAVIGLGDEPYLLCLGRVDEGKGSRVLAECFAEYRRRRGQPLALVYAGPVADPPPPTPGIVVAGPVDEQTKWGLLRGATALVSPSAYESFAIVLLEAWSVGTAALVNGRCPVTLDHAERSGGALTFVDYPEFEAAVDRVVADDALRAHLGANGRDYVDRHYRWDDLVARYTRFLTASCVPEVS